jgi:hypothetical protein
MELPEYKGVPLLNPDTLYERLEWGEVFVRELGRMR